MMGPFSMFCDAFLIVAVDVRICASGCMLFFQLLVILVQPVLQSIRFLGFNRSILFFINQNDH